MLEPKFGSSRPGMDNVLVVQQEHLWSKQIGSKMEIGNLKLKMWM